MLFSLLPVGCANEMQADCLLSLVFLDTYLSYANSSAGAKEDLTQLVKQ